MSFPSGICNAIHLSKRRMWVLIFLIVSHNVIADIEKIEAADQLNDLADLLQKRSSTHFSSISDFLTSPTHIFSKTMPIATTKTAVAPKSLPLAKTNTIAVKGGQQPTATTTAYDPICSKPTTIGYDISGCPPDIGSTYLSSCNVKCAAGFYGTATVACPASAGTFVFGGCRGNCPPPL